MTTSLSTDTTAQTVISKDGTHIHYETIGTGVPILIVPGANSIAHDFAALAAALADTFTVHTIERRGRGLSGATGKEYSIAKECDDIYAVQQQTDAHYLFGHSYGGLIAFEAARNNPALRKIAVYEPGVSINRSISIDWTPAFESHKAQGKYRDAFSDFVRGTGPAAMKQMPNWLLNWMLSMAFKGAEWDKTVALLPSTLIEHKELARLDNTYPNYREVSADVLLMAGGGSPKFREDTLRSLSSVLPHSEIKILPKRDHFAPTKGAPAEVAQALKAYFLDEDRVVDSL